MKEVIEVFKSHKSWNDIKNISSTIITAGYQCYLVGGCIRDALIRRPLKDFDLVTNARPEEVAALFSKTLEVGSQFGVVVVVIEGQPYEVATLREESGYSDSRHPDKIIYTNTIEADSKRRDFTMNAIYFDLNSEELKDPQNGIDDVGQKNIKTVGLAKDRFEEDSLRVLRAFRFMAQTGFSFSEKLKNSLQKYNKAQFVVSKERKTSEFNKLFEGKHALQSLNEMNELGFLEFFFSKTNFNNRSLSRIARWYDLLVPSLNFDNFKLKKQEQKTIEWLSENNSFKIYKPEEAQFFDMLKVIGSPEFRFLEEIVGFDQLTKNKIDQLKKDYMISGELPEPLISGADLIGRGCKPGSELGLLLRKAYKLQVTQKIKKPEELLVELGFRL